MGLESVSAFIRHPSLIVKGKLPVKNWVRRCLAEIFTSRVRFLLLFPLCGNFAESAAWTELLQNPHLRHGDRTYSSRGEDIGLT